MDFLYLKKEKYHRTDFKTKFASTFEVFKKRNQKEHVIVDNVNFFLSIYDGLNSNCYYKKFENNDFIVTLGTLFYKEKFGLDCLHLLFNDFKEGKRNLYNELVGSYSVIISLRNKIFIFNDFLGLMRVYYSNDGGVFSTSFLAIVKSLNDITYSKQEIFEYILRGGMYGDKTIFKEINLNPRATVVCVNNPLENEKLVYNYQTVPFINDFDEMVKYISKKYLNTFNVIVNHFNNNIAAALSGGYDSRLMLALLKKNGIVPFIYVYGNNNLLDVKIAKKIAKEEGFDLKHIDKEELNKINVYDYAEVIENNFYYFDGFHTEGIFDNGTDVLTRILRSNEGRLQLNGGGGEIWRDFWNLNPLRKKTINFVRHKWDIFDYKAFTSEFDKKEYFENFSKKVEFSIHKLNRDKLTRKEMEMSYPLFRNRYWQSIGNSINLRFSHTLMPLIDASFLYPSFDLSIREKYNGKFEAALIREIDPKLASYTSNYGHNFLGKVPIKNRVKSFAERNIPIKIKPYLRNIKTNRNQFISPNFLSKPYIEQVLNLENANISEYVDINKLKDPFAISRALSLEYLFKNI